MARLICNPPGNGLIHRLIQVLHEAAFIAPEVIVAFRITVVSAGTTGDFQFQDLPGFYKEIKVTVDCPQADIRYLFFRFLIYPIRNRVRIGAPDDFKYNFSLF